MPEDPALAQAQALVQAVVNSYPQLFRQDAMDRFPSAPTGSETGAEAELLRQDAMDRVPSEQEDPPPLKRQKRLACVLQD